MLTRDAYTHTFVFCNAHDTAAGIPGLHAWKDQCSLATDNNVSNPGILYYPLGVYDFSLPLVAGGTWSNSRLAAVLSSVPYGEYFVVCVTDSGNAIVEDGHEDNNQMFTAATIHIVRPADNYVAPWAVQGERPHLM